MKKLLLLWLIVITAIGQLHARDGYRIQLKLTDRKDSLVYLAHYFGKPFPTIFKSDSAKLDKRGYAVFDHKEKITGGIYLILPSDRSSYFEFLLDNGDDLSITATINDVPKSVTFRNSPANDNFKAYSMFLLDFGTRQEAYKDELSKATTRKDSAAIREKMIASAKDLKTYRTSYAKSHPNTFMANVFNAMETPEIPEGKHYLPDGKEDSSFAFRYYKGNYWNKFNFKDDRLIHTPLLQNKLDEYFNRLVYPQEDSSIKEADSMLAKVRGTENLFKFTLSWLSTNAQTSKIMGMDKVFVHLVENYYMKGDATWLTSEELSKYIDRAQKIAPNVINNPAPQLKAIDADKNEVALYDFKAHYTLLVFYAADCGHCVHELPLIDSVYRAELKAKGVRIFAFNVETNEIQWREFITKHHLEDWYHVWDPNKKSRYWALYDVYSTPSIYLLDDDKIIIGKKLDHTNISKVVELTENRKKTSKK